MEENVREISFGQLLRVVVKYWWIVLIAAVLGVAIAFTYVNFFATPMYTSNATVGVNNANMTSYQDAIAGQTIAVDSAKILTGNVTLERAAEMLNNSEEAEKFGRIYTAEYLYNSIQTTASEGSRYVEVEVKSAKPEEAKVICSYVISAFCEILAEQDLLNGAEGKVISNPELPKAPSSPNKPLIIILGGVVGLALSTIAICVIYFSKDTLDGEDWLIDTYKDKIPMLSIIPDSNNPGHSYKKYGHRYGYNYTHRN